jgi:hypothetical protein
MRRSLFWEKPAANKLLATGYLTPKNQLLLMANALLIFNYEVVMPDEFVNKLIPPGSRPGGVSTRVKAYVPLEHYTIYSEMKIVSI